MESDKGRRPCQARALASAALAAFAAAAALVPAAAVADQADSGDTAVYVVLEQEARREPPASESGSLEGAADAGPVAAGQAGTLPETGDGLGACVLAAALAGAVSASCPLACRMAGRAGGGNGSSGRWLP